MSAYRVVRLAPYRFEIQVRTWPWLWRRSTVNLMPIGYYVTADAAIQHAEQLDERKRVVWP